MSPEPNNTTIESLPEENGKVDFHEEVSTDSGTETTAPENTESTPEVPTIGKGPFKRFANDEAEMEATGVSFQAMKNRQNQPEVTKPDAKPALTPRQQKIEGERDYSGIDEGDVPEFKKMGNDAFAKMKPIYLRHKEFTTKEQQYQAQITQLKNNGVPQSYYQHPKAYVLSPQYGQIAKNTQLAQAIQEHWTQQLVNIRRGEPFVDLQQDAQGNFSKAAPREATTQDEASVMGYLTHAQQQYVSLQSQQRQFEDRWSQQHNTDVQFIKSVGDQYFPGFDDPKHPTSQVQKTILESLPESQRESLLAPLLAKTGASNMLLQNKIKELESENNQLKAKLGLKGKQQPQPKVAVNGESQSGVSFQAMRFRNR